MYVLKIYLKKTTIFEVVKRMSDHLESAYSREIVRDLENILFYSMLIILIRSNQFEEFNIIENKYSYLQPPEAVAVTVFQI